MEHKSDGDTKCSALVTIPKRVLQGLEDFEIREQVVTIQTTGLLRWPHTEKSLGDLKRLAVTQTPVKDHQLKLM